MRYLVQLSYDGSNYFGWSKQREKNTIQGHLEEKISKIFNENIVIHSSGRTDKGVHALNQYFHFNSNLKINPKKLINIINKMINNDIYIKNIKYINDDFHARYSSKNKTYFYLINIGKFDPFKKNYEFQFNKEIDIYKLQDILNNFIGLHDFLSFSTTSNSNSVRRINSINVSKKNNKIKIEINGNGFLRYMVRMIIGYSLKIYENKKEKESIEYLLKNPKKGSSLNKIDSCGLYLYNVYY